MRRYVIGCCAAAVLVAAPAAAGSSLPSVSSGERPGPPLLYGDPPNAPPLSVDPPFRAKPLLVSGSDALRDGEYLYQDYLFDDRGADTAPFSGTRDDLGMNIASPTAGDVRYPTAGRFANNAADIVELRIKPTGDSIVYRLTLNTVKDEDAAVVGIGIDTDRSGSAEDWPGGAGISSPGIDRFITAWGTGGEVARRKSEFDDPKPLPDGTVEIERKSNQMEVEVPRDFLDPREREWRYVAGTGLYAGDSASGGRRFAEVETGEEPTEDEPASGSNTNSAPGVFNLAFRFDEPQEGPAGFPEFNTFPGVGNWFEDRQAKRLREGTTGGFHADVDFGQLAAGVDRRLNRRPGDEQARIFASSLDLPEGLHDEFPAYGGQLQPYILTVPPAYDGEKPRGLTFSLHSLGGTYTQYAVFSPNQLRQFGDQRDDFVVTPLGRGTDGWYTDEAEADVFEVWADVARRFELESEQVALSGYSMGGYGTYKLGTQYPDLFGKAFTTVGPPAREVWAPPVIDPPVIIGDGPPRPNASSNSNLVLENARWVPYLNWNEAGDELVPASGPTEQQRDFDRLGLRSRLRTFAPGEHFTLAIQDQWEEARDFLGAARVTRDPSRVNYAFVPAADRPGLGLLHDHAYWVSNLRERDGSGDPDTDPARGEIDARSQAFGEGDPDTRAVQGADPPGAAGPPQGSTFFGTAWNGIEDAPKRNRLLLELVNVERAKIAGRRARLDGDDPLRVRLESDGEGEVRLALPLPEGAVARRIEGGPVASAEPSAARRTDQSVRAAAPAPEVELDGRGATFDVAEGTREYEIAVGGQGSVDDPAGDGPSGTPDGGPGSSGGGGSAESNGGTATVGLTASSGAADGGGSLPFTGLALGILALVALALLGGGLALRRAAP